MKKRNLFAEISEGFEALKQERAGKITLLQHVNEATPLPESALIHSASPLEAIESLS